LKWQGIIARYGKHLPVLHGPVVTLLEGNTPLVPCPRLSRLVGAKVNLLAKVEGTNPTGSFKDRGMTVAISKAAEEGHRTVICASTGNTAASAAAYAARAGMRCFVLIPGGEVARGKLAQAIAHGAQVLAVEGSFDAALKLVRELSRRCPVALVNSLNPNRIEGQKTAAFEICDALGDAPEFHALPVGNAGNITAYWKGFLEYSQLGLASRLPRLLAFQAEGAAPLVLGHIVANPETFATAIRIGNPASGKQALAAAHDSQGLIAAVSDDEIREAYRLLSQQEGLFVEPASAAGVAGLLKLGREGFFPGDRPVTITCTLTGHGLKDPDAALALEQPPISIPAQLESAVSAMGLELDAAPPAGAATTPEQEE